MLLFFGRIIGVFPFEILHDQGRVEAIKTWKYLLPFILITLITDGSLSTCSWFLIGTQNAEVLIKRIIKAKTDFIAFGINLLLGYCLNLFLVWKMAKTKGDISSLINLTGLQKNGWSLMQGFTILIASFLESLGFLFPLIFQDFQWKAMIMVIICVIHVTYIHLPCLTFLWSFEQIFRVLESWVRKLKMKFSEEECLDLINYGLFEANRIFSTTLLGLISLILTMITVGTYLLVSFLLNFDGHELGNILTMVGYSLYSFTFIFYLYAINNRCQKVMDQVKCLKTRLIQQKQPEAAQMLDSFKGFDCCGFFMLGRPLLTSITATFVTYFIILLQFRFSE